MVRFHAVASFASGEWTVELAKGDQLAGRTATCTFHGSFDKDHVEHMIDDMAVLYFDFNLAPWEIEATIEWKGEGAHREWLEEWRARRETQQGPTPPRSKPGQALDLLYEEMLREYADE